MTTIRLSNWRRRLTWRLLSSAIIRLAAMASRGNKGRCPGTGRKPWKQVGLPSSGREAVDRQSITLEEEDLIKQVNQANSNTVVVLISSFPYAINWTQEHMRAIVH